MQVDIGMYRSTNDRWIRGVCGGIGKQLGISSLLVRLAFLLAAIVVPGISLIMVIALYVVLGIVLPERTVL